MTYHAIIRRDVAPETCPLIDSIVEALCNSDEWIREALHELRQGDRAADVERTLLRGLDALRGRTSQAEEVRKHNMELREALAEAMRARDASDRERDDEAKRADRAAHEAAGYAEEVRDLAARIADLEALA